MNNQRDQRRKKKKKQSGVKSCAPVIEFDEGWFQIEKAFNKLKRILEGAQEQFVAEEYINHYTVIYNMCSQGDTHDFSQELYDGYEKSIREYINSTVTPSLREKSDEFLLRELARRWSDHNIMVRWLSRFFCHLDRFFVAWSSLPNLKEAGMNCFHKLVYEEFKCKAADAVFALINLEREENLIDRALLKNIKDMYVDLGMKRGLEFYENNLENAVLKDASDYYSRKASLWIVEDSCPDYMIKVEDCLKKEKARVSHYLHSSTETKLLEVDKFL